MSRIQRPLSRPATPFGIAVVVLGAVLAGCSASNPAPPTTQAAQREPSATTTAVKPTSYITPQRRLDVGGCPLFPVDNAFHATVTGLRARSDSSTVIAAMGGRNLKVRPAFSAGVWEGSRSGIPVNVVDSRKAQSVDFVGGTYAYMSDLEDHPIPDKPRFEGWPGIAWDRHLLVVDSATCESSEFFHVTPPWEDAKHRWLTETAVKVDLRSNIPSTHGTATASGTSMLAGMIRYDEVASGALNHVVGVSVPEIRKGDPVWPATKSDGRSANAETPQMGTWLRLRSTADLSQLGAQAKVVAKALQTHGAVIVDTNKSGIALSGEPDERWDDKDIKTLGVLSASDFEVVDPAPMMISSSTHQIR